MILHFFFFIPRLASLFKPISLNTLLAWIQKPTCKSSSYCRFIVRLPHAGIYNLWETKVFVGDMFSRKSGRKMNNRTTLRAENLSELLTERRRRMMDKKYTHGMMIENEIMMRITVGFWTKCEVSFVTGCVEMGTMDRMLWEFQMMIMEGREVWECLVRVVI